MPTTENGYVSLETGAGGNGYGRSVYNATTEPGGGDKGGASSVIKSMKRAIGQAITGGELSPSLISAADGNR